MWGGAGRFNRAGGSKSRPQRRGDAIPGRIGCRFGPGAQGPACAAL